MITADPTTHLTEQDLDLLAEELDALRIEVTESLGKRDADYIKRVVVTQRSLEFSARALLLFSRYRAAFVAGTGLLTVAKIIENMEIGHNVMHGQWDWMNDPVIHSSNWEWDAASTARSWKRSHNYDHHMFTNVLGKDRDLGYATMRVDPKQPWHPIYLAQPVYGLFIAMLFEWGIAIYDLDMKAVGRGEKTKDEAREELRAFLTKARRQVGKDYILMPLLSGRRGARRTLVANFLANAIRNVWVHTIVHMGHLPDGAVTFTEDRLVDETRGQWYARQLVGSCNLEGTPLFHFMSGNLSHQIEHHLYPDMPSNRYAEISPRVAKICEKYGLPYTRGRLGKQYRSVAKKVVRLSFPGSGT